MHMPFLLVAFKMSTQNVSHIQMGDDIYEASAALPRDVQQIGRCASLCAAMCSSWVAT